MTEILSEIQKLLDPPPRPFARGDRGATPRPPSLEVPS